MVFGMDREPHHNPENTLLLPLTVKHVIFISHFSLLGRNHRSRRLQLGFGTRLLTLPFPPFLSSPPFLSFPPFSAVFTGAWMSATPGVGEREEVSGGSWLWLSVAVLLINGCMGCLFGRRLNDF